MGINQFHLLYINNSVLLKFIRTNRIKFGKISYSAENMAQVINSFALISDNNHRLLVNSLYEWLYQGRKKMLYRYFDLNELEILGGNVENVAQFINSRVNLVDIGGIENLRVLESCRSLIDVKYILNSKGTKVNKIIFLYLEKVNIKNKATDNLILSCLPVFITIDLENSEITARVCVKSDIYKLNGDKVDDIKIAKEVMEYLLQQLGIEINLSVVQKSQLRRVIFEIHKKVTELPDEIIQEAEMISDELSNFVETIGEKIDIINDETIKEEITYGIKKVILKHVISMWDDKGVFETGKYAISNGINASGISMSKVEYHAPAGEPVQCNPEYQDIQNLLDDTEHIRKNVLLWNSVIEEGDRVRSKVNIDSDGYIQIFFEQYVLEGDIQNVLSKVRESL